MLIYSQPRDYEFLRLCLCCPFKSMSRLSELNADNILSYILFNQCYVKHEFKEPYRKVLTKRNSIRTPIVSLHVICPWRWEVSWETLAQMEVCYLNFFSRKEWIFCIELIWFTIWTKDGGFCFVFFSFFFLAKDERLVGVTKLPSISATQTKISRCKPGKFGTRIFILSCTRQ